MKSIGVIIVAYKLFIKCGKKCAQMPHNININNCIEQKIEKDYDGWCGIMPYYSFPSNEHSA